MVVPVTNYDTSPIAGVNLQQIWTAPATGTYTSGDQPPVAVGTRIFATNGSEWIFAKSTGTAIVQYDCVFIDMTFLTAIPSLGSVATGAPLYEIGFYQNATSLASGDYAWFMISGFPTIRKAGAVAAKAQLYTTQTSGLLDDAVVTGSQYPIRGVYVLTTNPSATATSGAAVATYPTVGVIGAV